MWVKLLLLALAINLEPVRIALVPVLLARARPALANPGAAADNRRLSRDQPKHQP